MDNAEIKTALCAKGVGDAALVAILGGAHVYESAPQGSTEDLDTWVTFFLVSESEDLETGRADQVWQFDVWGTKSVNADNAAARVGALYGWTQKDGGGTLPGLTTRRLAEPVYLEPGPGEMREEAGSGILYHKVRQFRVATYPV